MQELYKVLWLTASKRFQGGGDTPFGQVLLRSPDRVQRAWRMDCRVPKQATEHSTVVVRTLFHLVDLRPFQLHELVCQKTPVWTRLIRQRSSLSRGAFLKVPFVYFFQFDVELYEAICEYAAVFL